MSKIGIIGGSGLDDPNIFKESSEILIETPYGDPSSKIKEGRIEGHHVAILSRHGFEHSISPSKVNFRANIWALKKIGCTHILATTAVGSLGKTIEPGHIVFPNQFIDFTKQRISTFYDKGEVVHSPMAEPWSVNIPPLILSRSLLSSIFFPSTTIPLGILPTNSTQSAPSTPSFISAVANKEPV